MSIAKSCFHIFFGDNPKGIVNLIDLLEERQLSRKTKDFMKHMHDMKDKTNLKMNNMNKMYK